MTSRTPSLVLPKDWHLICCSEDHGEPSRLGGQSSFSQQPQPPTLSSFKLPYSSNPFGENSTIDLPDADAQAWYAYCCSIEGCEAPPAQEEGEGICCDIDHGNAEGSETMSISLSNLGSCPSLNLPSTSQVTVDSSSHPKVNTECERHMQICEEPDCKEPHENCHGGHCSLLTRCVSFAIFDRQFERIPFDSSAKG